MFTGITLIKNGINLKYPFELCIKSMASYCDEVIINIGYSSDNTMEKVFDLIKQYKNIKYHIFQWSEENTGDGRELAIQINNLLPYITQPWVVYLQADEFILNEDIELIKKDINNFQYLDGEEYTQVELLRTYFYKSLNQRKTDGEIWLGRIFKNGTHTIGGDGMYLNRYQGRVWRAPNTKIFHYSKIGTEKEITKRVRQLDLLFHPEEEVKQMKDFCFEDTNLISYNGPHPKGILEFYKGLNNG